MFYVTNVADRSHMDVAGKSSGEGPACCGSCSVAQASSFTLVPTSSAARPSPLVDPAHNGFHIVGIISDPKEPTNHLLSATKNIHTFSPQSIPQAHALLRAAMPVLPADSTLAITIRDESSVEYVPIINRKETMLGLSIFFQILAWIAVIFRLYARFHLTRAAGWDDLLVVLAAVSVTIGTSFMIVVLDNGLGHHVATLSINTYSIYLHYFWAATISYFASTALIKVSLLVQYLRLFKKGSKIYLLIAVLIVIVSSWGITYAFLLGFSCTPARKFWQWSLDGTCFGFGVGSDDPATFFAWFATHSAFNMAFDVIVLAFPIFSLSSLDLEGRRKYAIAGLATLGSVVVGISIGRLASIAESRAGTYPSADPTWLAPTSFILSCLEVDVAILCASVPVFWPIISALTVGKIFVVDEVIVRTEDRLDRLDRLERVSTAGSETELRSYQSSTSDNGGTPDHGKHYKDPYVIDRVRVVDGPGGSFTHTTNIEHTTVPLGQIERLI